MSRLTDRKLIKDGIVGCVDNNKNKCNDNCIYGLCKWIRECLLKLKEYEDLEEQGLLIKLPCKVRTEVFYICQKNTIALEKGKIYKAVVSGLYAFEKGVCVTIQIYDDYGCTELEEINNFGKTVFLTKEEAEKALERLECAE